jgi:putative transposon-encoded protein
MADNTNNKDTSLTKEVIPRAKVKFEVYGEEMIEKEVKSSGNSGRIYLPPNWVGHIVKIIKVE